MKGTVNKRLNRASRARWAYVFDVGKDGNGKRKQITKSGFLTQREAQDALRKAMEEHRGKPAPAEERHMPTFAEFFEEWHTEVASRKWSRKTVERTRELAQYAIRIFGETPLDQLADEQLTKAMNHLLDKGGRVTKKYPQGRPLAPKTVRHIAFLVQACLHKAVVRKQITENPMAEVDKPKVPRRKPKVVDRDGFGALLRKTAGMSVYPVILLGNATGMRRGELCAIEWTDLNWNSGMLEVSKSLEETMQGLRIKSTKSGKSRTVPIPVDVLGVLQEHKREQDRRRELYGTDYKNLNLIFARPDGDYYSPDKLGTRIRYAMQRAGLAGVSLHSLRHSHVSELLASGVPATVVADRVGHASPRITLDLYAHALPGGNEAAAKVWNDAMSDVIRASRKEAFARKRERLANVSEGSEKICVIPIKSAG